jgi:hypothetical protein
MAMHLSRPVVGQLAAQRRHARPALPARPAMLRSTMPITSRLFYLTRPRGVSRRAAMQEAPPSSQVSA